MGKIVTSTQSLFEHYCKMQYKSTDLSTMGVISLTGGAMTDVTPALSGTVPAAGSGKWVFVSVDSIVPVTSSFTVTLKVGAATKGIATVAAGAGLDSCWVFDNAGSKTISIAAADAVKADVSATGIAGVRLTVWVIDAPDSVAWTDLGQNFTESLSWNIGPTTAYVPRGWSATDHSKRIRNINNFTMRQMYCSNMEGVANLRGQTVLIMDQIFTDGGSVAKEMYLVTKCQFNNVTVNTGGMGGETMADTVDATGVFSRKFVFTFDADSIAAGM